MTRKSGIILAASLSFLAFSFGVRADEHADKHDDKKHDESHGNGKPEEKGHAGGNHDHAADVHGHDADHHDHPADNHGRNGDHRDRNGGGHASVGHDHHDNNHRDAGRHVDRDDLHRRMSVRPGPQDRARAFDRTRGERARFTRSMSPFRFLPGNRLILHGMHIVPGTYYYRRGVFYDTYGWVTPPWAYNLYPRYGLWDTTFLAFALAHVADPAYAMFFYDHWRDPEIVQWMADSNRLAAQNAELRAELDAANQRTTEVGQTGAPRDPAYVPPDAQDVALSPDAIDQLTKQP